MGFELGPVARARGVGLVVFGAIPSTNDEAKALALAGERGPLWVVAARQTAGRGRLGRSWISSPGNLHASLILSGAFRPEVAPQLGFVAGVALLQALAAAAPGAAFALKWPNDLLLERAKLGGILVEGANGSGGFAVVVGIGVNCASAPEGLPYPARALSSLGPAAPSAGDVLTRLSDAFTLLLDIWAEGSGFAEIRRLWLGGAAGLGETVRLSLAGGEEALGRFEGLDAGGRLILRSEAGERVIDAGDVFLAHGEAGVLEPSGKNS